MNNLGKIKIAEDNKPEDYSSIDTFGIEMLQKMGWKGDNDNPNRIKPVEFKLRCSRLGLGAQPLEIKKTEKEKNNKKESLYGLKIKIIKGKHKGLKGKIVEKGIYDLDEFFAENKFINVELKINNQTVKLEKNDIILRNRPNDKILNGKKSRSKSRSRSRNKFLSIKNKLKWVLPNIVVRVISKKSKYYNTKAVVQDLTDLKSFTMYMLHDNTIQSDFTENELETVIPEISDNVIILKDEHRGEIAKLLDRDKKNNKVIVQLQNDFSICNYSQDDICEIK